MEFDQQAYLFVIQAYDFKTAKNSTEKTKKSLIVAQGQKDQQLLPFAMQAFNIQISNKTTKITLKSHLFGKVELKQQAHLFAMHACPSTFKTARIQRKSLKIQT